MMKYWKTLTANRSIKSLTHTPFYKRQRTIRRYMILVLKAIEKATKVNEANRCCCKNG
jgi:hypothetical protein